MKELLRVLGKSGSKTKTTGTISFQIEDNILIDAGNVLSKYGKDTNHIEHVVISHSHFDHICDLPFLIENGFTTRVQQLHIYGLKETVKYIKQFMFNDYIWPDFSLIPLLTTGKKSIKFNKFKFYETIDLGTVQITPFPVNHIVPTAGFVVEKSDGRAFMISSDTYITDELWNILNSNPKIKYLLIEVSFHSELDQLAQVSKHLTPNLLNQELEKLERDDVKIYIYHIKESSYQKVLEELKEYPNLVKHRVEVLPDVIF